MNSPTGVIIAALFLHAATTMVCGSDVVLKLERLIPPNHELSLAQLRAFDSARHGRLLQSPVGGVVDFPVDGASDPFLVGYYCCYPFAHALSDFDFRISLYLFWFPEGNKKKNNFFGTVSGIEFENLFPLTQIESNKLICFWVMAIDSVILSSSFDKNA